MEENLPPGFRFHPTDEELITYYLTQKVSDLRFASKAVSVVDLNKCEPWDLPEKALMGEKEWYFFSLKDRKYPTGLRTNRATEAGYWKTTGKDKEILLGGDTNKVVGMKKTLVFYKGRAPRGEKSNWVMHEYRLQNNHPLKNFKEEWVVCRVFEKSIAAKRPQNVTSSREVSPCEMGNELADFIANPSLDFISSNNNNSNNNNVNYWNNNNNCVPSSWPSHHHHHHHLLSPMNSLLLKALHLRTNQQLGIGTENFTSYANIMGANIATDHSLLASSSTTTIDDHTTTHLDQPFNMDSMNW